jgi:hypothetical protein
VWKIAANRQHSSHRGDLGAFCLRIRIRSIHWNNTR